jgi:hypothetical protein
MMNEKFKFLNFLICFAAKSLRLRNRMSKFEFQVFKAHFSSLLVALI